MLVRSNTMVFHGGRRIRVNPETNLTEPFEIAIEEGKPLPKHLTPADGSAPARAVAKPVPGQANAPAVSVRPSKKEIMAQLSAAGIKYNATQTADALFALLTKAKKAAAPAASTAPSKDSGAPASPPAPLTPAGTGDQDVI